MGEKTEQRAAMLARLAAVPAEERRRAGVRIARAVLDLPELAGRRRMMLFLSMADELDTDPLVDGAIAAGLEVYAPRTFRRSRRLLPVRVESLGAVRVGTYGIREPASDESVEPGQLGVIVVPAVAFDRRGWRLGRGGGFYDRLLEGLPRGGLACGIAYDFQVVDEVVREAHDRPVDLVVTESEVIRPRRPAT